MADYQLVKLHHPDSIASRDSNLSSELRNERFNSISRAYDILRGIHHLSPMSPNSSGARRWPDANAKSSSSYANGFSDPSESERERTGRRNQWGGWEYKPHVKPDPGGATEPFFMTKRGTMASLVGLMVCDTFHYSRLSSSPNAIVTMQTVVILTIQLTYISPSSVAAYKHLEARHNLEEARRGGKERGLERRQELERWIEDAGLKGVTSDIGHGGRGKGIKISVEGKGEPPPNIMN